MLLFRSQYIYISGLVSLSGTSFCSLSGMDNRPNIVLIMTDQQSYDMISYLNNSNEFSTPNLDKLFCNGVSFSNCYVANPVSVASRFSLMTGQSPAQFGVRDNLGKYSNADETAIRKQQEQCMGALFSNAGYDTYYGGKVHLPFAHGKSNMFASTENYKFQNYFTRDEREGLSKYASEIINKRSKSDKPMLMVLSYLNPHDICAEVGTDLTAPITEKDSLTAQTILELRALADITSPEYYPALPLNIDKTRNIDNNQKLPYQSFKDEYWRRYRFIYFRLVELVDRQIGKVLDAIYKSDIADNTIIVFTSDHGEMNGAHCLRTKNVPYSECQKVPFVFFGKGIDSNKSINSSVCNGYDLLPTLCEFAGINTPDNIIGESLVSKINNNNNSDDERVLFLEGAQFYQIVYNDDFKYTCFTTSPYSQILIDLQKDKFETLNIINDADYYDIRDRMRLFMNDELNKRNLSLPNTILGNKDDNLTAFFINGELYITGFKVNEHIVVSDLKGNLFYNSSPSSHVVTIKDLHERVYIISSTSKSYKLINHRNSLTEIH